MCIKLAAVHGDDGRLLYAVHPADRVNAQVQAALDGVSPSVLVWQPDYTRQPVLKISPICSGVLYMQNLLGTDIHHTHIGRT